MFDAYFMFMMSSSFCRSRSPLQIYQDKCQGSTFNDSRQFILAKKFLHHIRVEIMITLIYAAINARYLISVSIIDLQSILNNHPTQSTRHSPRDTVHATQSTRHSPRDTVHATQSTRHSPRDTVHATQSTRHSPRDTVHATQSTRHSPRDTVHATQSSQHIQSDTVHAKHSIGLCPSDRTSKP